MVYIPELETAHVSPDLQLAYIDSFSLLEPAERPETYTTILAIHGVGFNSTIFSPMIPHLPPKTRLLAYSQRSYRGSSSAFECKEPGGFDATAAYLEDFLRFLEWSVRELGVASKQNGGRVVVLSWSKGTVIPISLLALLNSPASSPSASVAPRSFLDAVSPDTIKLAKTLVASHIEALILFEPPGSAFARPPTRDFLESMSSVLPPNEVTREEWALAFAGWVAEYRGPRDESEEREQLAKSQLGDFERDLVEKGWEWGCVAHGFQWTLATEPDEIRRVGELALRGKEHGVQIGVMYGSRTVEYFEETVELIREWWEKDGGENRAIRSVEGTNHFGFVHKPREFVDALMNCLKS